MGREGMGCIGGAGVQVGGGRVLGPRRRVWSRTFLGTVGLRWVPFERLGMPEGSGLGVPQQSWLRASRGPHITPGERRTRGMLRQK